MLRKTILVDPSRCLQCSNCWVACKDEHCGNDWSPIAAPQADGQWWIKVNQWEEGSGRHMRMFREQIMCQHCERCALEAAAPDAVYTRDDGIVIIDPEAARGRRELADACPYHAVYWNEELQLAQKCTMCAHLLDAGWEQPRCVTACPNDALAYVDPAELIPENLRAPIERLHPEFGTEPQLCYTNRARRFLAGEVASADLADCVEDAHIVARHQVSGAVAEGYSNSYGDFTVFVDEPGFYTVSFEAAGYKRKVFKDVDLRRSHGFDVVKMQRRVDAADDAKLERRIAELVAEAIAEADWERLVPQPSIEIKPGLFGTAKVSGLGGRGNPDDAVAAPSAQGAAPTVAAQQPAPQPDAPADAPAVYQFVTKTPIGNKKGTLKAVDADGVLKGSITFMGKTVPIDAGTIDAEGNFTCEAVLNSPIGALPSKTTGTMRDGRLEGVCATKMGDFVLKPV